MCQFKHSKPNAVKRIYQPLYAFFCNGLLLSALFISVQAFQAMHYNERQQIQKGYISLQNKESDEKHSDRILQFG